MKRSKISIYAALAANVAIATVKFIAGGISGSAAMIAEGVHSLVDSVNELLLLYGIYSSNKERDKYHPFGYGRELYFWSFIVSILIFALGAGVSFYQGYVHIKRPAMSEPLYWNYIVLAFSLVFEGVSFIIAFRQFRKTEVKGDLSIWGAVRHSKDPTTFMVLFEDGAAVIGVVSVLVCLILGHITNNPYLDGIASLLVGVILTAASALLARESRSLIIGEGISSETEKEIVKLVKNDQSVVSSPRIFSIYQSPEEVLLLILLSFKPETTVSELNDKIEAIKQRIKQRYPKIAYIVIQPEDNG
jgi:cation diffusion facilitator family transporter